MPELGMTLVNNSPTIGGRGFLTLLLITLMYRTYILFLPSQQSSSDVKMTVKDKDAVEISTKTYSVKNLKRNTSLEYGSFIKTAKLTQGGTENYSVPVVESEALKSYQGLTDDDLFAACGGRTAHKGARHGLKLSGKLSRIEKQEKLLLKKMKKVSLSDNNCSKVEKKLRKIKSEKDKYDEKYTPFDDPDMPSTSNIKKKKRKSVSFNETVTKIYTNDPDTSFDSEVGSVRDENSSNDANNNSDEGIEQDSENNNNELDVDNHRAFEEARLNFSDLSKAERKKLKKKRKLEAKNHAATTVFLMNISQEEDVQEDKEGSSKKRKYLEGEEEIEPKRSQTESPSRLKRKKNKKKKHKQKKEEAKAINSITKSLEGFCRISESE
ncbi:G patch domain-containing protein 4 isoform X2 [Anthonomus grandis grandis]|uniref:G patch domain-containing protein 4 isoform X2 n=1 Tax=Anthonomus grandis grandis TaxID=2921223 RepID=UPI002165CB71|nr:G patch domain-containing protein 4 isoform X2 [Anthonomus grandis grandis]